MLYRTVFEESKKSLALEEFGAAFATLLGLEDEETKRMFMKVYHRAIHISQLHDCSTNKFDVRSMQTTTE
jgi:hypothetical protein